MPGALLNRLLFMATWFKTLFLWLHGGYMASETKMPAIY
jgi:hypothetical protein